MRFEEDELLTVTEIAALLNVSPQTIRNRLDAGRIPHVRVGERRVRVWRSDLRAFIENGATVKPTQPAPPEGSVWDGVIPDPVTPGEQRD